MGRLSSGKKVPGRSLWPEPDTIRNLTKQSRTHKGRQPIPLPPIDKFPRAAFGLPIIFHFKDNGDPRQTVLQPKEFERLSSPLILKPLACQQDNYIGLAMIFAGSRLGNIPLELKTQQGRKESWEVQATFDRDEKLTLQDPSNHFEAQINSQTDLLQVFLQYL
jgi:CRISPR-associated protein Cmr1